MENTLPINTAIENQEYEALRNNISERISEAASTLNNSSKEKYNKKIALIENAPDMSTKEKLSAMDQSYDRYRDETWQTILCVAGVSLAVLGIFYGSPVAARSIRRLIA